MVTRSDEATQVLFLDNEYSNIFASLVWGVNPMDADGVVGFDPEEVGEFR